MSGGVVALFALAGFGMGIPMTWPINSYLAQLRREGIAARPALWWGVALTTAATFALAAAGTDDGWHLAPLLVAATTFAAVSATDVRAYRIADRILFPSIGITLAAMVIVAAANDSSSLSDVWRAIAAALVFCAVFFVLALVAPGGGLGFGDVKLALLLGLALGWTARTATNVTRLLLWAMLLASILGVLAGVALGLARQLTGRNLLPDPDADPDEPFPDLMKTAFPFGPGLVAGTLVVVAMRDTIAV